MVSLPLALATWWSIITPGLAILTLPIGALAMRRIRDSHDEATPITMVGLPPGRS